jgi:hypothetical protein
MALRLPLWAKKHLTFVECADWGSAVKLSLMEDGLDQ